MSRPHILFRAVCLILACVTTISSYTLFDADNAVSSEITDVHLRSKRDATSRRMPAFYDVSLRVNGKDVHMRLDRNDDPSARYGHQTDWAGYTSKDTDGIFIVRQDNLTGVQIEGYMVHNGVQYLVQPDETIGRHVIHALSSSNTIFKYVVREKKSPSIHDRNYHRTKRDQVLLDRNFLIFKCKLLFDYEALKFARKRLSHYDKSRLAESFLSQFGVLAQLYVSRTFTSLDDTLKISFVVTSMEIQQKPFPGLEKIPQQMSPDKERATLCPIPLVNLVTAYNIDYKRHDHLLVVTGFDLLNTVGHVKVDSYAPVDSVCSPGSVSTIEYRFNLNSLKGIAQNVMTSMGVRMDGGPEKLSSPCPASSNYIMSPGLQYYKGPNLYLYSQCSKNWLRLSLSLLSSERSAHCLRKPTKRGIATGDLVNPNAIFDYNKQCWLAFGWKADENQDTSNVCHMGIKCVGANDVKHIEALPGTFCTGGNIRKTYWCIHRVCEEQS